MIETGWYAAVFAAGAGAIVPLAIAAERVGRRLEIVDRPRRGELQRRTLPRTGGYAVFVAFWLAILASFLLSPSSELRRADDNARLLGVFLGALALLPLAVVDDVRRLGPLPQLAGQTIAASIPVAFGLRIDEVATPFGILVVPDPIAGPLAVLWVVAMVNAINLVDTMDGLASGIAAIACGVLFLRSAWFGQASIAVLPVALGAVCVGFLTRNWHPARVILGSSGALFLGYMLGVITVIGGVKIGTAFLVLAVPILDVAWVAYRRLTQGRSPLHGGDAEHLPHRLHRLGISDRAIVLGHYGVSSVIGAAVLLMHSAQPRMEKALLLAAVVSLILAGLALLARVTSTRAPMAEPPRPDQ